MDFTEKLAKLTENLNKSRIAKDSGLSTTAISDYLQKGHTPRADKALTLARSLKVPLEWLVDDAQDWPPPASDNGTLTVTALSDSELMREVARRHKQAKKELIEKLDRAEAIDWGQLKEKLDRIPADAAIPREILPDVALAFSVWVSLNRAEFMFDLGAFEKTLPDALIGLEIERALDPEIYWQRIQELHDNPAFSAVFKDAQSRPSLAQFPERVDWNAWMLITSLVTRKTSLPGLVRAVADSASQQIGKNVPAAKPVKRKG